jgi:hypothetical protein
MGETIRDFPAEVHTGPWPVLLPTPEDKQYQALSAMPAQQAQETIDYGQSSTGALDLLLTMFKGLLLGGLAFALSAGIVVNRLFWLTGWHWAFALLAVAVLLFLFGIQRGFLLMLALLFLMTIPSLLAYREVLLIGLLFLVGGIVGRVCIEFLP